MHRIIGSIIMTGVMAAASLASEDSVRVLRSHPTNSPSLDGVLNADWWSASPGTDFVQLNPNEGEPSTQRTEVRIMHSPKAIFVAFRCYDSEPEKVHSILTKRDRISDCDQVTFYLDPYHDHRTGYYFTTNPDGVQQEGVMYNDDWMDMAWDGYWEVATTRDDSGWTAEMKIPLSSLRFKNGGGEHIWGMNAQRYIYRDKESTYWQSVKRDTGRRVSLFGHLEGLSGLEPGTGLELRPYAVADFREEGAQPLQGENDWENLGLDAKYRLASNLILDATINPDFAQIEADDEVINLSDYPVYLEEKRPFFLEGTSIFDTPFQLFYSRRITNPEAGAKLSGKIGSLRVMGIAARNLNEDDDIEDFGVLRLKQDIFKKSEVGILLTDKEGPGDEWARVWGADAKLRPKETWTIDLSAAQSFKPELTDNNWQYRWEILYTSDKYSGSFTHSAMMRDFQANDAGWTNYSDYQRIYTWLQYAPRPEKWGIRKISNNYNATYEGLYDLSHKQFNINYNLSVQTMNYWWFGGGAEYSESYRRHYAEEGEVYTNTDNFGNYNFEHYYSRWWWAWFETDYSKPFAFSLNYSLGDFRDGYEHDASLGLQVRPRNNLSIALQNNYGRVTGASEINDGAATDFFLGRLKAEWTLTRRLFTRLNVQYVYGDEIYFTNALLGYNFAPESYFYLAYDDERGQFLGWDSVQNRTIKAKVSYFVQI